MPDPPRVTEETGFASRSVTLITSLYLEARREHLFGTAVNSAHDPWYPTLSLNVTNSQVYEHNFPRCKVTRRSIEHLSAEDLDAAAGGTAADIWLLRSEIETHGRSAHHHKTATACKLEGHHVRALLDAIFQPSKLRSDAQQRGSG